VIGRAVFKAALIQMLVTGGRPERNLARAARMIARAKRQGARLAVLPETLDLGWTHASARKGARPVPDGEPCQHLAAAARETELWVCAGLTERDGARVFNTAVLLDPAGRMVLKHRKINELDFARASYDAGRDLVVADTEFGVVGLLVCADAFAEGLALSRELGRRGARMILSPCAWAVEKDHDNAAEPYGKTWTDCYCPVAAEFGLWFLGASNVGAVRTGPWRGRRCIGCSLAVAPGGRVAARGPYGVRAEAVVMVDVASEAPAG